MFNIQTATLNPTDDNIHIDSQKDVISRKIKKNFIQTNLTQTALAAKRGGCCRPDKQRSFKYQHEKYISKNISIIGKVSLSKKTMGYGYSQNKLLH